MNNYLDFPIDKADVFLFVMDKSSSMRENEYDVIEGLEAFRESFRKFPDVKSIAISNSSFSTGFYPKAFEPIDEFDITYNVDGWTALNYSIVKAGKFLVDYIEEIISTKNFIPKATFIFGSDGKPENDRASEKEAKLMVEQLNNLGITTVFLAFGSAITSEYGKRVGFQATKDVKDKNSLTDFLGIELSKSCKEQSKSIKALGANFFSTSMSSKSEAYSNTTAQVLDDDSFMFDI